MNNNEKEQLKKNALIIAIIFLVLACFPLPYGYYNFLRILITLIFGFIIYTKHEAREINKAALDVLIVILFNPFVKIYFEKDIWICLDLFVAVYSLYSIRKTNKK